MNGGDGKYSYTKNSTFQRDGATAVNYAIKEIIMDKLDIDKLLHGSNTFTIADFGCSVGPNTFITMQTLIETVKYKYHQEQGLKTLEFQVLFNDQTANDFNTLFASLPQPRDFFAAGIPGSFHSRLFPSSSIHFAYSSYALHWLSKLPEELLLKDSPAWNGGKIHYTGASDAVVKAYAEQFEKDMETFLRARAEEIIKGGMIVIIMPGVHDGCVFDGNNTVTPFFESILTDMVNEVFKVGIQYNGLTARHGVVGREQVDSFNMPFVTPCMKDVRNVVEKNGSFEIVKMETRDIVFPSKEDGGVDFGKVVMIFRAIIERTYANHFGNEITNQVFERIMQHKLKCSQNLESAARVNSSAQLFVVLKHK